MWVVLLLRGGHSQCWWHYTYFVFSLSSNTQANTKLWYSVKLTRTIHINMKGFSSNVIKVSNKLGRKSRIRDTATATISSSLSFYTKIFIVYGKNCLQQREAYTLDTGIDSDYGILNFRYAPSCERVWWRARIITWKDAKLFIDIWFTESKFYIGKRTSINVSGNEKGTIWKIEYETRFWQQLRGKSKSIYVLELL